MNFFLKVMREGISSQPETYCQMASCICPAAIPRHETHSYPTAAGRRRTPLYGSRFLSCHCRKSISPDDDREGFSSENAVLRTAWYGSEFLGIIASFFRPASPQTPPEEHARAGGDGSGIVDRAGVVEAIKDDFRRSYFVTGNLSLSVYNEDCEFADPAGSFRGLRRFKRNCSNFGSLLEKSNMKLMKWEEYEDKVVGHWSFSCVMSFPWRPILSATGYTEYYFDAQSGKISRHVEHWNVPKMALLKQIFKPSRWIWDKS